MNEAQLEEFLNKQVEKFNQPSFIANDPVSIPHRFTKRPDVEIAGFFAAIFSWGNRRTIIQKSQLLMKLMGDKPHEFILNHQKKDLKKLLGFKHRTFNDTDLLYFIHFLQFHYRQSSTLETAFLRNALQPDPSGFGTAELMLNGFYDYFFSLPDAPRRSVKHIASPAKNSTCKRLNMFLRWMVRADGNGVDFGIWNHIPVSQLVCPIDLHVSRVAKRLGLLTRKQTDWRAALELTGHLRILDPSDPVKYDYALFGLGVMEHY